MKKEDKFDFFHYDARVTLWDGSTEKIGKIVNQKLSPELLGYDNKNKKFIKTKINDYIKNGDRFDNWVAFEIIAGEGSGKRKFKCTPNQKILTANGERKVRDLKLENTVFVKYNDYKLNQQQKELILGSALGDGYLRKTANGKAMFRVKHGYKQLNYLLWKKDIIKPLDGKSTKDKIGIGFDTLPLYYFGELRKHLYDKNNGRMITREYLEMLTDASIAAWYMDDGTLGGSYEKWGNGKALICNLAMNRKSKELVQAFFGEIDYLPPTLLNNGFLFSGERAKVFFERIAPYIHPSMQYKIPPKFRKEFIWDNQFNDSLDDVRFNSLREQKIVSKYNVPVHPKKRYLWQVVTDNDFFIDNVLIPKVT